MTVSATTETRKQYTGNSGYTTSTDFTAAFKYLSTSEIKVTHTNTTSGTDTAYVEGTHYSVQSGASATSVTIRFLTSHVPTATTEYVTIFRETTFDQLTDYTEGSTLDAETLEQNFDKGIMLIQQVNNNLTDLNISFTGTNDFNTTAAAASDISVSKANRASKALKFNSDGDIGVSTYDPDAQITLATAQAAAASGSATTAAGHVLTAAGHVTTASEWATKTTGQVASTDYSSKEFAIGTTASTGGSSKDWAVYTSGDVRGGTTGDMSAKEWAVGTQGRGVANEGSSKDWATYTSGTVDNSGYSAKYHADLASSSALAAKNSAAAVASALDSFDDKYLGTMSDSSTQGTNPTPTGTWAKNSSSITVSSASNIKIGQLVTGSGIPTGANVLSIDGTTVVISENMAAAGSSVSLTFTGYGVYGTYNGTKDGPTTDNDNGALADGMLYFNTTDNNMMVYKTTGAKWIPASSTGTASLVVHKFTASGSETSVAAASFSPTLTYTPANIIVFLNGVRLDATDYTATNGNDITGLSALSASDEVVVYAFKSFEVADTVSAASGGTFSGNVTHNGDVIMATTAKIKQKGAFMQSSTNQAWVLGG